MCILDELGAFFYSKTEWLSLYARWKKVSSRPSQLMNVDFELNSLNIDVDTIPGFDYHIDVDLILGEDLYFDLS